MFNSGHPQNIMSVACLYFMDSTSQLWLMLLVHLTFFLRTNSLELLQNQAWRTGVIPLRQVRRIEIFSEQLLC